IAGDAQKQTASAFPLTKQVDIELLLDALRIPTDEDGKLLLHDASFVIRLTATDVFSNVEKLGKVALTGNEVTISSDRLGEKVALDVQSVASVTGVTERSGVIQMSGEALNVMNEKGEFNKEAFSAEVTGKLVNAPVFAILDEVLDAKGTYSMNFGHLLNADLTASLKPDDKGAVSGPFTLNLAAKSSDAKLPGTISMERLTLDHGAYVRYQPREDLFNGNGNKEPLPQLKLTVDTLELPLDELDPSQMVAAFELTLDQLVLPQIKSTQEEQDEVTGGEVESLKREPLPRIAAKDVRIVLNEQTLDQDIVLNATGKIFADNNASDVTGMYTLRGLTKENVVPSLRSTTTSFANLPTAIVERFSGVA
ncbi:MAG: hypothetical protein MI741_11485, partial [Rhodospirillales bacterium]|nr:hypothetical protein [Rhodospirillales bacterium]